MGGTVYVNPDGSDGNHGRSADYPLRTFDAAFRALEAEGPILDGNWVVEAAAGVYPMPGGQATHNTQSINRVIIKGPSVGGHPNEPVAVIDGTGGGPYRHGLSASGLGVHAEFRDLKFVGFTAGPGDSSRVGCLGENESSVLFTNVHVDGATWCGVYAFNTVRARVHGGVFTGCRSGVVVNDTEATVKSTIVRGSTETGIYWSRGSQGHIDYATFEGNAIGFTVGESSRVDEVGNTFRRNRYNIRTHTGGIIGQGGKLSDHGTGADAPKIAPVQSFAGSGYAKIRGSAHEWLRVAGTRSTMSHTGTTEPTLVYAPHTVRAGTYGLQVEVVCYGVVDNASGGSLWARFGGAVVDCPLPVVTAPAPFELRATLMDAIGGTQAFGRLSVDGHPTRVTRGTGAFDPTQDQQVGFGATLSNPEDRVAYHHSDINVL